MNAYHRDPRELLARLPVGFLSQDTRLCELSTASGSGVPTGTLLVHKLRGWEEINLGFRYAVEALSGDAFLELKNLGGLAVRLALLTATGDRRAVHGVVTEAESLGSDGGLATYRLVVEPATAVLDRDLCFRVILGKTDLEAALLLLREAIRASPDLEACFAVVNRTTRRYPVREFILVCGESHWHAIRRLLARAGISFLVEPVEGDPDGTPRHRLVLTDQSWQLGDEHARPVRFHRADGTEDSDTITRWEARRTLACGRVVRRAWDHRRRDLPTQAEPVRLDQGPHGNGLAGALTHYEHDAPREDEAVRAYGEHARLHAERQAQRSKTFSGEGSVREFRAGSRFRLEQHPVHDRDPDETREFLVTRVELEAENNLPAGDKAEPSTRVYRNRFTCLRTGIPVVPGELPAPYPGLLTGTVVGPAGEAVFTDALGRSKVRFHGTLEADHPEAGAANADRDSGWIRHLAFWTTGGLGANFPLRGGDPVAIDFFHRDPDRPVIVGVLAGGVQRPARFSDWSELPGDKALAGLRSGSLKGAEGGELVFDDTPGALRTRLASDHAETALNLGFLVHPRRQGQAEPRGEGAELRTDGAAAIRAARGLLLTAAGQFRAKGPQLAREELVELLEAFRSLTETLGSYAGAHRGLAPKPEPARALGGHLQAWEAGTCTNPGAAPPAGQRLIALSAPDGLAAATPKAAVVYAGESLDLASRQDGQFTVGQQLCLNAGKGLCLFAHGGGLKAIAHQDDLELEAQHGDLALAASRNVKITARENEVLVVAGKQLTLACGGSYLTISAAGVEVGGPAFTGKTATVSWPGAGRLDADLPKVDMGPTAGQFQHLSEATSEPLPEAPYTARTHDGRVFHGKTAQDGHTQIVDLDTLQLLGVDFAREDPHV